MAKLPDSSYAFLVVHSNPESRMTVRRVADFLNAMEEAYNGVLLLNRVIEGYDFLGDEHLQRARLPDLRRFGHLLTTRQSLRRAASLLGTKSHLRIEAVEIGSPDFWSFIGKAIPFETIRQWMQDRHECRKDRAYREAAEERKLDLDNEERELSNELKRMEVVDRKIEIAKQLGATEKDFEPLLHNLFYKPLKRLDKFDDVIESVEVMTDTDMRELPGYDEPKSI